MRRKAKKPLIRFQAELSPTDAAMLDSLKARLGVHSNAKLLMEAAAILKWIVTERHSGRKIASLSEDTPIRELVSAVIECSVQEPPLPYVELRWTPKQLDRIHALLSVEPHEPNKALTKAISGQ